MKKSRIASAALAARGTNITSHRLATKQFGEGYAITIFLSRTNILD
jgi:hypothetical protein